MEVAPSFLDREVMIAASVTRRLVAEELCPPTIRITGLDDSYTTDLIYLKQKGNRHFMAKTYKAAIDAFEDAIDYVCMYHFFVAPCNQILEVVNILSNQAECYLRLHDYDEAAGCVTNVIILDGDYEKARITRAKVELASYKRKSSLLVLVQACVDLDNVLESSDPYYKETARILLDEANGF
mmetsp:Transcript_61708/g.182269  ORF Transcript_61708/g.182269 Transcript_61708/m.182269 type:complete len:182 (-) Transcript_61708:210-755(-)